MRDQDTAEDRERNRTERRDREAAKRRHGMRVSGGSAKVVRIAVLRKAARGGK